MNKFTAFSAAALTAFLFSGAVASHAQLESETVPTPTASGTMPADVKPGDWAYQAIQDCAAKGLIAGYPPDGDFLGHHAITRFEAATIVARLLVKIDAMSATPGSGADYQTQIDEISKLTDEFKVELTVIGTNMTQAQADITQLQSDVSTLQAGLGSAYDALEEQKANLAKVKTDVSNSYGNSSTRKFSITGYIQARAVSANGGNYYNFPNGSNAATGPVNGFYAQSGSRDGFQVRRARLKFAGQVTANTTYAAQFDFSGATSTSNQQLTTREAWVGYTFGDGTSKYPMLTAGLFANPFGYILPSSTANIITPERPLAFSEGSYGGPFAGQDYDKGVKLSYAFDNFNVIAAVLNGTGRNSEDNDNHFDDVLSASYTVPNMPFTATIGGSYYNGLAYYTRPSSVASPALYPEPKKDIADVNAQVGYDNFFVNGEYEKGTFETLGGYVSTAASPTTAAVFASNSYVKGNIIQGYYVMGGYNFNPGTAHVLTFAVDYDQFQRSLGHPNYDDDNIGYGALYNLDKATRLRLWYDEPTAIAHSPSAGPFNNALGMATAELQVKF